MKRFHVHVAVNDITESVRFYSQIFSAEPTVLKPDYAKWMVEDPRINFAISARGSRGTGVNHLGFQVESDEDLKGMRAQLAAADAALVEENAVNCCYAKSDKYWVTDPQGIAWETWHNLGSVPMFGEGREAQQACCVGDATIKGTASDGLLQTAVKASATSCCAPADAAPKVATKACCA